METWRFRLLVFWGIFQQFIRNAQYLELLPDCQLASLPHLEATFRSFSLPDAQASKGPLRLATFNFILPLTRSMSSISVCQASSSRLVLRMGWGFKVLCAVGSSIWPKGKSGSKKGVTRLTNKKQGGVPASGAEGTVFDRARSNTLLRVAFQRKPSPLPSNLPQAKEMRSPSGLWKSVCDPTFLHKVGRRRCHNRNFLWDKEKKRK